MNSMKCIHAGLGPIGKQIVQAVVDSEAASIVGVLDADAELVGGSVGEIVDRAELSDVMVARDLEQAVAQSDAVAEASVLTMATVSRVPEVQPQIMQAIDYGLNVVSTAEELSWPWLRHEAVADEIDEAAKDGRVTVVGTGINPGFLLDLLPLLLCRPCRNVRSVVAKRIVNVSLRRRQLQEKVGSGLRPAEFENGVQRGVIGHVGLGESAALLAAGIGWQFDGIAESIDPVIADEPMTTEFFDIGSGDVIGSDQKVRIDTDDGRSVELTCRMTQGEPDPRDEVIIDGDPPVNMRIDGGIFGDTASAGCTVNILRQVVAARAGLLTVKDLPVG